MRVTGGQETGGTSTSDVRIIWSGKNRGWNPIEGDLEKKHVNWGKGGATNQHREVGGSGEEKTRIGGGVPREEMGKVSAVQGHKAGGGEMF